MNQEKFNEVVIGQMDRCTAFLLTKGMEYAPDTITNRQLDRLSHFKKAALLTNTTAKAALFGMLSKHLVSLGDMCMGNQKYIKEKWEEKITDSINYLFLLRALVEEEMSEKN